jgi:hypothetical protein
VGVIDVRQGALKVRHVAEGDARVVGRPDVQLDQQMAQEVDSVSDEPEQDA